jgi:hypothetical protein
MAQQAALPSPGKLEHSMLRYHLMNFGYDPLRDPQIGGSSGGGGSGSWGGKAGTGAEAAAGAANGGQAVGMKP